MIACAHSRARGRRKRLPLRTALLAALLALAAAAAGCHPRPLTAAPPSGAAPDRAEELVQDGLSRTVLWHLPPHWTPRRPWPLLVVLHGGGGRPEGMREISGLDAAVDARGFIAVYPEGYPRSVGRRNFATWNAGRCCGDAAAHHSDDVGFLLRVIDRGIAVYAADRRRVYVTGFSNGAQMAYRMACEYPERIAAIAPVAAQGVLDDCPPGRTVPLLHIHGTDDRCTPYAGGTCGGCFARVLKRLTGLNSKAPTWLCDPVRQHVAERARRAGFTGAPRRTLQHSHAYCDTWGPRADGAEVVLCTVDGGGHAWPGGSQGAVCRNPHSRACRIWREELGEVTNDLQANTVILDFLSRHRLPAAAAGSKP